MGLILFKKAKLKVNTMDKLLDMKNSLIALGDAPYDSKIYDYAVKYFNIITDFQDNVVIDTNGFAKSKEELKLVNLHIKKSGREEYGWVRSKKGEPVTLDNLYLGNIHGLNTKTARFFKNSGDAEVQTIIQDQLKSFINSHRKPLIENISKVLGENKKPKALINFGNNNSR